MKKTYLLLLFLIIAQQPANVFAQSKKGQSEISASAGLLSTDQVATIFADGVTYFFTLGLSTHKTQRHYSGAVFFSYHYHVMNKLSLGIAVGKDNMWGKFEHETTIVGSFTRNTITVAPEICYDYINLPYFRLYGLGGIGVTFGKEEDTYEPNYSTRNSSSYNFTHPNFQVTPLGLKVGNMVNGFLEFGFGYKGFINIGLSAKF